MSFEELSGRSRGERKKTLQKDVGEKPATTSMSIRVPTETLVEFRMTTKMLGVTMTDVIVEAMERFNAEHNAEVLRFSAGRR